MHKYNIKYLFQFLATVLGLLGCPQAQATVTKTMDTETGLAGWKLSEGGFELELIQRLPDQTRAFFLGRGFSAVVADDIARSCVFQAIGRNRYGVSEHKSVSINLRQWLLKSDGRLHKVKLKEQWDSGWPKSAVSTASRIAFRWATFPTEQTFEPVGDYNWGMISFDLPPGTLFDLQVRWSVNGLEQQAWLQDLQCPADIHVTP